ncbi:MAG: hypothetical protein WDO73_06775 [Ignavibacteriota bacterium]
MPGTLAGNRSAGGHAAGLLRELRRTGAGFSPSPADYDRLTAEDLQRVALQYLVPPGRTGRIYDAPAGRGSAMIPMAGASSDCSGADNVLRCDTLAPSRRTARLPEGGAQ